MALTTNPAYTICAIRPPFIVWKLGIAKVLMCRRD